MLTNLIINQLIRLCFKLDQLVAASFFCFTLASNVASDIAGLIRRDAGVCFILITRSGVEEMKSERKRKRGVTRNWRNYDFKRLSPCPPFVLPRASRSPFLGEGKEESTREKPPCLYSRRRSCRGLLLRCSFKLLSDLNTGSRTRYTSCESRMCVPCTHLNTYIRLKATMSNWIGPKVYP